MELTSQHRSAALKPEDFEAFFAKYEEMVSPELELAVFIKYYSPGDNLTMNKMDVLLSQSCLPSMSIVTFSEKSKLNM